MIDVMQWSDALHGLFDWDGTRGHELPGACVGEWLGYFQHDYDDVDRLYIDHEIIGG